MNKKKKEKDKLLNFYFLESQILALPAAGFAYILGKFFFHNLGWGEWIAIILIWIISTGVAIEKFKEMRIKEKQFEETV